MIFDVPPPDFKKRFDIVGCLIVHKGTFVLLKRHTHKANGGKWGLPAGKVDAGEDLKQALVREVKEETGLKLREGDLALFKSMPVRDGTFDLMWHMFVTNVSDLPDVVISDYEHAEHRWVTLDEARSLDLIHDLEESLDMYFATL